MSRKGENIYKRKDGRWEARYIKGYTPDGKVIYGYCYAKTYRDAKEKQLKARNALLHNENISTSAPKRFSYYCDQWMAINRNRLAESTLVKYSQMLNKHIKPAIGGYYVDKLSSLLITEFSNALLHEKNLSPKSVKDILTLVNSILKYIKKVHKGPMLVIDIVYPKESKKEMRVLSKDEQLRFTRFLTKDIDACKFGILLAMSCGLRIGEICAMKWSSISMENMCISVSATMQRIRITDGNNSQKTKVVITPPKTDTSIRTIPLPNNIIDLCRQLMPENRDSFILTGKTDKFMEPRALQYRFNKYTQECALDKVNFHALRHTFATRCVEVGFDLKSLSEILGHSSPKITLERYVHSSLELKRNNMNKLDEIAI